RSTPKSDRPLNSARFLNLAVAALVLTPRSRQRLQCRLPCRRRRLARDLQDPWMPTSTSPLVTKDAAYHFLAAKHVIVFDVRPGRHALEGKVVFVHVSAGALGLRRRARRRSRARQRLR